MPPKDSCTSPPSTRLRSDPGRTGLGLDWARTSISATGSSPLSPWLPMAGFPFKPAKGTSPLENRFPWPFATGTPSRRTPPNGPNGCREAAEPRWPSCGPAAAPPKSWVASSLPARRNYLAILGGRAPSLSVPIRLRPSYRMYILLFACL